MNLWDGETFNIAAAYNVPPRSRPSRRTSPFTPHPQSGLAEVVRTHQVVHVQDIRQSPAYLAGDPNVRATGRIAGARTIVIVPMMKENELIGTITIYRQEVGRSRTSRSHWSRTSPSRPSSPSRTRACSRNCASARRNFRNPSTNLRTAQDRLIQTEKLASLGQLTAGIAHEIKNPLNFVNNFSALSRELIDELNEVLKTAPLDDKTREEIDELTHMLKGNLEKVVQHGKRADSIVKNMLLHSREGSGEHRPSRHQRASSRRASISPITARARKNPASTSRSSATSIPRPA